MKIEIKNPDYLKAQRRFSADNFPELFNKWFTEEVEPINKMLSEGVEVYNTDSGYGWADTLEVRAVRKATLINIQPIKKETAEDVLRDIVNKWWKDREKSCPELDEYEARAKAVLDE